VIGIGGSITDEDIEDAKAQWEEDEPETNLRRRSEIQYRKSLLAIANQIGQIVDGPTMVHRPALTAFRKRWWTIPR
jgi:hypothetical protein